jgi:hypothetical protein
MPTRRKKRSSLIALVWAVNVLGAIALLAIFLIYGVRPTALAAQPVSTQTPSYQAPTPFPTRHYLPTVTPNPQSTQVAVASPTLFVLPYGQKPVVVGYSVLKRPIEIYTFGQGEKQRMIVAGIHGGYEWNTIALADQMITYINDHPEVVPSDVTLFILRDLNPDGDARDHGLGGRVNDHGVDLNRNFPVNWSATWDRTGCFDQAPTTSGTGPASEPETRLIINFLSNHRVQALISYHSAALGIFPGGSPWDGSSTRLAEQIATVSTYPYPPIQTGCVYAGTLADYAVSKGIAAVELELTDHEKTDFTMNLRVLKVLLEFQP